jgi:hypothetical protein
MGESLVRLKLFSSGNTTSSMFIACLFQIVMENGDYGIRICKCRTLG